MKVYKRNDKAITLIALVVTIVVLLILAGVSIGMLAGENGIIKQAQNAKVETKIGEEKEAISVAYSGCKFDYINSFVPSEKLQEEMMKNGNNVTVEGAEELTIIFVDTNNEYILEQKTGKIEYQKKLTPEEIKEAQKIVSAGLVGTYIYTETAGGEVRLIEPTAQTAIEELDTTGATILTTNGIREKGENYLIDKKGKVYTWGYNRYGQLGNGTTDNSSEPICISELEGNALKGVNIVDIETDEDAYTLIARGENGKVYTWGRNNYDQLGNGTTDNSSEPICISELEGNALNGVKIIDIETNGRTVIARDENCKIYTWGKNNCGELGNGTTTSSSKPICISELDGNILKDVDIVEIHVGHQTVIARDESGKVYTWGYDGDGQLGKGTIYDNSSEPICISELEGNALKGVNIADIVFEGTVVAIDENGKVYTWGNNQYETLGNGTTEDGVEPICISEQEGNVLNGVNIIDIESTSYTVIARDREGKVYTWGYNDSGQLGNGTTEKSSEPICISEIEGNALNGVNIVEIQNYSSTVIARDENGKIYAWGSNAYGQLGNGTTENSTMPICISNETIIKDKEIKNINVEDYFDNMNSTTHYMYVYISTDGTAYKYYYSIKVSLPG